MRDPKRIRNCPTIRLPSSSGGLPTHSSFPLVTAISRPISNLSNYSLHSVPEITRQFVVTERRFTIPVSNAVVTGPAKRQSCVACRKGRRPWRCAHIAVAIVYRLAIGERIVLGNPQCQRMWLNDNIYTG